MTPPLTRRLLLLGSTGSIGVQTVEVVRHLNALADKGESAVRYEVVGFAAGRSADALFAQATSLGVRELALHSTSEAHVERAGQMGLNLRVGSDAAERLVHEVEAEMVLGAIVGSAGLGATLAAVELGRAIALANKETLVAAGELVIAAARASGSKLLPVDSEHSAIWQCLGGPGGMTRVVPPCALGDDIRQVILTASGGALRERSKDETYHATPEEALAHPTWSMGAKVTIDSASLTNKALEVIEAHWLYGVESSRIGVVVHPQSIVHAMVEMADGSVIAQCGAPDMRTPIQYALTHPHRVVGCSQRMDIASLSRLDFEEPDLERFPALSLGYRVVDEGGTSGAVFNGANEAAVEAFLDRAIPFGRIGEVVGSAMDEIGTSAVRDLADVEDAEREASRLVGTLLERTVVGK